ncbi:MAG TPA: hypothetical protein VK587_06835, partial [bacterium]|nr:hypothetical protein [bacterium]
MRSIETNSFGPCDTVSNPGPSDVRRLAFDRHAQGDRAAIGVPDHAAGGFGREHGDRVVSEQAFGFEVSRSPGASRFFVRHEHQPDSAGTREPELAQGDGCIDHRGQAGLHVRSSSAEQVDAGDRRLKLRAVLRRNHVVMAAEVDGRPGFAEETQDALADGSGVPEIESPEAIN